MQKLKCTKLFKEVKLSADLLSIVAISAFQMLAFFRNKFSHEYFFWYLMWRI